MAKKSIKPTTPQPITAEQTATPMWERLSVGKFSFGKDEDGMTIVQSAELLMDGVLFATYSDSHTGGSAMMYANDRARLEQFEAFANTLPDYVSKYVVDDEDGGLMIDTEKPETYANYLITVADAEKRLRKSFVRAMGREAAYLMDRHTGDQYGKVNYPAAHPMVAAARSKFADDLKGAIFFADDQDAFMQKYMKNVIPELVPKEWLYAFGL